MECKYYCCCCFLMVMFSILLVFVAVVVVVVVVVVVAVVEPCFTHIEQDVENKIKLKEKHFTEVTAPEMCRIFHN